MNTVQLNFNQKLEIGEVQILLCLNEIIYGEKASFRMIKKNVLHLCFAEHKRK